MKAHAGEPRAEGYGFEMRSVKEADGALSPDLLPTCGYCGSLTIDDAIKALQIPGTHYSGSDWKYGWPHKFYLTIPCEPYERIIGSKWAPGKPVEHTRATVTTRSQKFYSTHLLDATPEQIAQWNSIAAPLLGVRFEVDEKGLKWFAPRGYQASGTVAAPVATEDSK